MLVDNAKLEGECYRKWAKSLCDKLPVEELCDLRGELQKKRFHPAPIVGQHIAIDGKTIRGSWTKATLGGSVQSARLVISNTQDSMVTAFNTELGLALGQEKCQQKTTKLPSSQTSSEPSILTREMSSR